MTHTHISWAFLLLLFLTGGCEDEKVDIVRYGSLSGQVVDGTTYEPLPGVLISTSPASSAVLTNDMGEFSIGKLVEGEITVTSKKKEYLTSNIIVSVYEEENTEMTITLNEDENDYGSVTIYDPVPGNGAVDQLSSFTMKWAVHQSKSDITLGYDVFLFTSNSTIQTIAGESLNVKEVVVDALTDNTTYYWYVVAKYNGNIIANSPTWSFKTGDNSN